VTSASSLERVMSTLSRDSAPLTTTVSATPAAKEPTTRCGSRRFGGDDDVTIDPKRSYSSRPS